MTEHGKSIYNRLVKQYEESREAPNKALPSYIELDTRITYKLPIQFNADKWTEGNSGNKQDWEILRKSSNEAGISKVVLIRPYENTQADNNENIEYFKVYRVDRDNIHKIMLTVGVIDVRELRDAQVQKQEAILIEDGAMEEGEHLSSRNVLLFKNIESNITAESVASFYYSHSCYFPQNLDMYVSEEQLKNIAAWHNVKEDLIADKQMVNDKKKAIVERE